MTTWENKRNYKITSFKVKTDNLGTESDVTIPLILPTFNYFKKVLESKETDSPMLTIMKKNA